MRAIRARAAAAGSNSDQTGFLLEPFSALSSADLLAHFHAASPARYFPVSRGKAKHVVQADRILRHEFTFNNETHALPERFDWMANPSPDLEWLILLHKFYYSRDLILAYDYSGDERYVRKWAALVDSWIEQVPDGFIDSQVTGRRLLQWLLAFQHLIGCQHCPSLTPDAAESGNPARNPAVGSAHPTQGSGDQEALGSTTLPLSPGFLLRFLRSVESQAIYLTWNLTPEGNHRTIELYALFSVAVLFPEFRHAADLLDFAKRELLLNLRQDFLPDGVHRELSTDYHHTVLKNFLNVRELSRLNGVELPAEFDQCLSRALDFSVYAHKPDGCIPAINDGDVNSYLALLRKAHRHYPKPELLFAATGGEAGMAPAGRSRSFAASGYCVLRSDWREKPYQDGRYLFFDCGGLGFGSHGHYDLLSFEAAAYGRSLVVDPGRYTYHDDGGDGTNWRHAFKGTAAHNTVMVDGLDQIEYRSERPIGLEPQARLLEFVSVPGFDFLHGSATSPRYPVEHRRQVFFPGGEYWIVSDHLLAQGRHRYDCSFHLAAEAWESTRRLHGVRGVGTAAPGLLVMQPDDGVSMSLEQGHVSPEYGIRLRAPVIRFGRDAEGHARFHTVLYPFRDERPALSLRALPTSAAAAGPGLSGPIALRIEIETVSRYFCDHHFATDDASARSAEFDDIVCCARLLHLRRDVAGSVVRLHALGLEYLSIAGKIVWDSGSPPVRMSIVDGRWQLQSSDQNLEGQIQREGDWASVLSEAARRFREGRP